MGERRPSRPTQSRPRPIPHRDPQTGQFVSDGDIDRFEDVVQHYASRQVSAPASEMDGTTGQTLGETSSFEGVRLYEVADVLDRRQLAVLLWARHRLVVYIGSTQTADGTIRANFEVSTSPNQNIANGVDAGAGAIEDQGGTEISLEVNPQEDSDTDDVIGPSLLAVGFGPITDGTNGVGGAGTAGFDDWEGPVMVEPVFDSRDELFVNGQVEASNVSDAAIHADLETWHTYGIIDD